MAARMVDTMLAVRVLGLLALLSAAGCGASVTPAGRTGVVSSDPDDPAIWMHPADPSRSLILGTDKVPETGGLYVFGIDGALKQRIGPLDRPNNVDVEYGYQLSGRPVDIAIVTERLQHRLRVFAIPTDGGPLEDLAPSGLPVLNGETGQAAEPMGIAIYKRPRDRAVFAIVAPKTGSSRDYLWQYRLYSNWGPLTATLVRRFGAFSRVGATPDEIGEIEAVVVDDELGYVYYSDERYGIRKYHADPDHPDAARELAVFGREGYEGDREGLAIYATAAGKGYLVSSDQVPGRTRVRLYRREGAPGRIHDHAEVRTVTTSSDSTDGLDVIDRPLPGYPRGLLVMMNSSARNFLLYRWQDIESGAR